MIQTSPDQIFAFLTICAVLLVSPAAYAEDKAPDVLIKSLLSEVQNTIKDADTAKIVAIVDSRIMPNVDFRRMTASAVGPAWGEATPDQQRQLQEEFKILLVRVYAGALAQLKNQTISVKPIIAAAEDKEVLVRAEVKGGREIIKLDYRLEKTPGLRDGWQIYNLRVMSVWLVESYRSQFAQVISTKGVDGLIGTLSERNKGRR